METLGNFIAFIAAMFIVCFVFEILFTIQNKIFSIIQAVIV